MSGLRDRLHHHSELSVPRGWTMSRFLMLATLAAFVYAIGLQRFYSFNADHAVQIIMARYFEWRPADFYFWGQNRLGSLVPILLILPIRILHLPPLESATTLSLGIYLFCLAVLLQYCRSERERFVAFVALFFVTIKAYEFLLYTGHPYGPALALELTAFAVVFPTNVSQLTLLRLFCSGLCLSMALWVSETSAAGVLAIVWLLAERRVIYRLTTREWLAWLSGVFLMVPFILYWRYEIGLSGHNRDFLGIATPSMLLYGLVHFPKRLYDLLNWGGLSVAAILVASVFFVVPALVLMFRTAAGESPRSDRPPMLTFLALHHCLYVVIFYLSRHSYFGVSDIARFWVPIAVSSPYMLAVLTVRVMDKDGIVPKCLVATFLLMIVSSGLLFFQAFGSRADISWRSVVDRDRRNLQWIRAQGANRVTCEYWEALPLNVLSNFEVLAAPGDLLRMERFRSEFTVEAKGRGINRYVAPPACQ